MSQADFFLSETSVLVTPVWYSDKVQDTRELPMAPGDYTGLAERLAREV